MAGVEMSWEEARRISLAKNRSKKYPIQVVGINEYGILDRSATPLIAPDQLGQDSHAAARSFADAVNTKLANSKRKDIYVYTHGYKVIFDNPILVANELWHFLGYDGVFVAYAWPSTPSRWAYLRDIETAVGFARNLRIFLEYLGG
ncbi:MAG: alpha/beta hydrolase [Desulfobacterales bacterium]